MRPNRRSHLPTLSAESLGPVCANLINKGIVYASEHGQISFTVPGMARFIHRQGASQ